MYQAVQLIAAAKATPVPGMGTQVAADLKDQVSNVAESAENILDHLPVIASRMLLALAVVGIGIALLKLGRLIIRAVNTRKGKKSTQAANRAETRRSILTSLFSYLMYFIIAAAVLRLFNVDVTSILAAAGVVGIAIAFGAQTMVQDILSGLFIWAERIVEVGDLISVNGMDGTVEAITIRTTTLRNYNGNLYTIPNGEIRMVTNMSRSFKRAIVKIPCPYEENQERLVAMIREEMEIAAQEVPEITAVPDVMSIVSFETHAVMVHVAVPCEIGKHWQIEREIRTRVKNRFDREGIVMPHFSLPEVK